MNFLGRSLIDVSGVTVVCSPFFFRNNGSRRRRWNGASVNSRQVTGRPIYNETSTAPRSSQSRAREKGGVSKFSLSRKLITECRLRRWRGRRWRRWLGGYFPGNSSRGRLARGLRLGRHESGYSSQLRRRHSPAISAQHSRHIVGPRVPRNAPMKRHISGDASSSNHQPWSIVQSICTRARSLSFSLPPRFPRSHWSPLVTSNTIEFCSFNSCPIVFAGATKMTKVSAQWQRTKSSGERARDFERCPRQLERDKESRMKSILTSAARRHGARNKFSIFRRDRNLYNLGDLKRHNLSFVKE